MSEYDKQGYLKGSGFKEGDRVIFPRMSDKTESNELVQLYDELQCISDTGRGRELIAVIMEDHQRARKNEESLQKDFDASMKFIAQKAKEYGSLQGQLDQALKEIDELKHHIQQYKADKAFGVDKW